MTHSRSTRRPVLSIALAGASAALAVSMIPREARADNGHFDFGIDGDANALLAPSANQYNLSTFGGGVKLRFGDHFHFRGGLNLTPEVGYAFDHVFSGEDGTPENMNRFFAGVRVGFGKRVVPTLYGHIGYGFRSVSTDGTVANNAYVVPSSNGLALDTGVAVEFRIARHLSIGPHVEFTYMDVPTSPQWLTFGGHLDFIF
jgi:hypothetical protein